jgi:hypothetical protein
MNAAHAVATVVRTSTTVFFLKALELLQPDVIVDVGSRDGAKRACFTMVPRAHHRLRAHPALAARMQRDTRCVATTSRSSIAPPRTPTDRRCCIADREVFNLDRSGPGCARTLERVQVPTRRLEGLLSPDLMGPSHCGSMSRVTRAGC